jgi:hypothetical protein
VLGPYVIVWPPMIAIELPTAVMIDPPTIAMFVVGAAAAGFGAGVMAGMIVVESNTMPLEPTAMV